MNFEKRSLAPAGQLPEHARAWWLKISGPLRVPSNKLDASEFSCVESQRRVRRYNGLQIADESESYPAERVDSRLPLKIRFNISLAVNVIQCMRIIRGSAVIALMSYG